MEKPIEVGTVVFSKSGRDAGRFFVVVEIVDEDFVRIADGDLRRLEKPKLKKIKHLKSMGEVVEKVSEKLKENKVVYDAELYSAVRKFNS